jgi:hypothetical protein
VLPIKKEGATRPPPNTAMRFETRRELLLAHVPALRIISHTDAGIFSRAATLVDGLLRGRSLE